MNAKRVLVFGGRGMLGHAVVDVLRQAGHTVIATDTRGTDGYTAFVVDETMHATLPALLASVQADYVVNAIGVIRPENTPEAIYKTFLVNSAFPQALARYAQRAGAKLLHVSTDCVFIGRTNGGYTDTDMPDATDTYGLSKALGEVSWMPNTTTFRTSIIGREIGTKRNLLDWFLANDTRSTVSGWTQVFWNGITTHTLARCIERTIANDVSLPSLVQLASPNTMSKYELLQEFSRIFSHFPTITPADTPYSNKTLVPSLAQNTYFADIILPLRAQIAELAGNS